MTTETSSPSLQILVVDDEPGMREMLEMLLSGRGHEVTLCASGEQALLKLSEHAFDLVLTDVKMPGMTGVELLERIQENGLPLSVIMMSAFVDIDTAIQAMHMGAADYVSKPFKADEVVLKIRLAYERQRILHEQEELKAENKRLRLQQSKPTIDGFVTNASSMEKVVTLLTKVADYKSTVLLLGESGTGKELLAKAVHHLSNRSGQFVPINCGAIPEPLLESELFGHVQGAFTDASRDKTGLVQEADEGTLFLDEIAELPLSLQVKLLRFLQEGEIRRVGDNRPRKVQVRVVAATSADLTKMVEAGTFREDLYYRLNVVQIDVPPLRQRKEDIPRLTQHFLQLYGAELGQPEAQITQDALQALITYSWPGNVRELENTIERALVLCDNGWIEKESLPAQVTDAKDRRLSGLPDTLSIKVASRALEIELIKRALEQTDGNRTHAAKILEISHRALLYKMKDYGIS
jgi:two-component system response regulator AtoC